MPPALTGHCLCGAVQFEVDQPLLRAAYCHCTRCQRRTGVGAGCSGAAVPGSVHVVAGEELITGYDPGDGGWVKEFCSVCGGHLFAHDPDDRSRRSVRMGAIDGDPGVRPSRRQFTAYAAVWEPLPDDGLERFPENANA